MKPTPTSFTNMNHQFIYKHEEGQDFNN